ncbi:NAD-dependent succinate-semialdehyde dehydrogenase [Parasphingorhabdus sp. JC815]|uniref:NAD-dependent succinate-semialdehyde dehydrogenase n=1 Tax=Parasphingorhabdus sp. JC815 TaxID=3232140 RepID=UPI003458DEF1
MSDTYPRTLQLHIDGEWIDTGDRKVHHVVNPSTGQTISDLPKANAADLDRALDAADRAFPVWRDTPVNERAAILRKAAELMRERAPDIGRMMTAEQGKPLAQAVGEVTNSANMFDIMAEEAKRCYGRVLVRPAGQQSFVKYQPVGPVAAFSPWNFPVFTPARKLAPALAAGCSIILKPAEETPASPIEMVRCLIDAGLPSGTAQVVFGDPAEVSSHLIASDVIRKVSFTGSVPVGKHLLKLAAEGAKRTTMELGGHAPVLVFDDCDMDKALDLLAVSKFRNAGQVCVSPTRFYVQSAIYEKFATEFTKRAEKVQVGDGFGDNIDMGPLANPRRPAAMEKLIGDARSKGADVRLGGEAMGDDGYFYRPTVLTNVPLDADIMNSEPFGPVAAMRPFDTLDEVIEQANRLPLGLAAYAFTENLRTANIVGDKVEAGMVAINNLTVSPGDAPFGGVKESGHGSEDGPDGLKAYMVMKAIHQS